MFAYSAGLMISVLTPISSVSPSGADLATAPAPRLPDAPGRLSTTMPWPHAACRCGASVRARMSIPVPGVNGTMIRTGLPGHAACARATPAPRSAKAAAPSEAMKRRRRRVGLSIKEGSSVHRRPASCRRPAGSRRRSARAPRARRRPRCARTACRPIARAPRAGSRRAASCGWRGRPSPSRRCGSRRSRRAPRATDPARGQLLGEADRVEDRLAGAVRAARQHRMRGIAEQRHAAEAPARQRVAVDHRIREHGVGRADQRGDVEPVEVPVGERGKEVVEAAARIPVAAAPARCIRARRPS